MRNLAAVPSTALPILLAATLSSCGGGSSGTPAATLGPAGGTLTVASGPLAGTSITIPAGALDAPVRIGVVEAEPIRLDGFTPAGPAVRFVPAGLALKARATITLPRSSGTDPVRPATLADDRHKVVAADADGHVVEAFLVPAEGTAGSEDTWQIDATATCWFVRFSIGEPFPIRDFLPVSDGDFYTFDDRTAISVETVGASLLPELGPAEPVTAFARVDLDTGIPSAPRYGRYLKLQPDGAIDGVGMWRAGSYFVPTHRIAHEPYPLFPAEVATATGGAVVTEASFRFDVVGGAARTDLPAFSTVVLHPRTVLEVPLGVYPDVLPVEVRADWDGVEVVDRYWLAWRVGIVRYEQTTIGRAGALTGGVVGGRELPPR